MSILNSLSGSDIVVRFDNEEFQRVDPNILVGSLGRNPFGIIIDCDEPLEELTIGEGWNSFSLSIFPKKVGKFRKIFDRVKVLRSPHVRIYLPVETKEDLTSIYILSSLGINCAIVFGGDDPDWDSLSDLMTYAVLEIAPHGRVEPFSFIAENYSPSSYTEWDKIYFDNPAEYLHVDNKGNVAPSRRELLGGEFLNQNIFGLDLTTLSELPEYRSRANKRKDFFLEVHPCTMCAGFRVCLGKFFKENESTKDCSAFFGELIEASEQFQRLHSKD